MDNKTCLVLLDRVRGLREKRAAAVQKAADDMAPLAAPAAPAAPAPDFADAVQNATSSQLKADAMHNVRNLALAALGLGAAGRGAVGLAGLFKERKPKPRSGPLLLPLPYPAEESKTAGFLSGDDATGKWGIPWYGPAMMFAGLGGIGLGWKGMDSVLDQRRRSENEEEVDKARQGFHDALLGQYDRPLQAGPSSTAVKAGSASLMSEAGRTLDGVWEKVAGFLGVDWPNTAGAALGGYGTYAGLTALLGGAWAYDMAQKRSRRSVLEAALKRRQRQEFAQRPNEIYAIPEPVTSAPAASPSLDALRQTPEE